MSHNQTILSYLKIFKIHHSENKGKGIDEFHNY